MAGAKTQKHRLGKQVLLIWLHIAGLIPWAIIPYLYFRNYSSSPDYGLLLFAFVPNLIFILLPFAIDIGLLSKFFSQRLGNTVEIKILVPILIILGYISLIIIPAVTSLPDLGVIPEITTVLVLLIVLLRRYIEFSNWIKVVGLVIGSIIGSFAFHLFILYIIDPSFFN